MTRRHALVALALAALLPGSAPCAAAPAGQPAREPAVQARIDQLVVTIGAAQGRDPAAGVPAAARELQRQLGEDRIELLRQLALYLATADGTEQTMSAALLIDAYEFGDEETVAALAPYVGADDPAFRRAVEQILIAAEPARRLLAEEDPARARAALDELARDPRWWVRLLAAHVARTAAGDAAAGILERLGSDSDGRVRAAATGS